MPAPKLTFGCNLSVDNYWDVGEFANYAETLGFDRITTGEHIMDGNPPRPTLLTIPAMAAAAGATPSTVKSPAATVAPSRSSLNITLMLVFFAVVASVTTASSAK